MTHSQIAMVRPTSNMKWWLISVLFKDAREGEAGGREYNPIVILHNEEDNVNDAKETGEEENPGK